MARVSSLRTWYKYLPTPDASLAGKKVDHGSDTFIELNHGLSREQFLAKRRHHPSTISMLNFVRNASSKDDKIISVAAANGEHEIHLILEGYDILVTDIDNEALDILTSKFPEARTLYLNVLHPEFATEYSDILGSFDVVFVPGLFYWLDESAGAQAIRNMELMVRPGGKLLITFRSRNTPITWFIDEVLLKLEQPLLRWNRRRKTGAQHYSYAVFAGYRRTLKELKDAFAHHSSCQFRSVSFGAYSHEFHRSAVFQKTGLDRPLGMIFRSWAAYNTFLEYEKPA